MRRMMMAMLAGTGMMMASQVSAQQAEGYWRGTLRITDQIILNVGVAIERGEAGELTGTLDSPDQNAFDMPLAQIAAEGTSLSFAVPVISAQYDAQWNAAGGSWDGQWSQVGEPLPLVLTPGEPFEPEPLPADWTAPDDEAIAALIEQRIALRPAAGMVVALIEPQGRRIVARGPVQGAAQGAAFDGDTLFEIGSMTKVFTALLLADMALKGEVALDDPVAKYLPEGATLPGRGGRQITLRNLSMHDSGLPRLPDNMPFGDPEDPYADYTEADMLAFLARHELARDIGGAFDYSNLGVGLLGYVLGRAGGSDYATLLKARILDPLGMEDTAITLSPAQQQRFATPHDAYMRATKPWQIPALAGAGALRSSAEDMLAFLEAALDPASPIGLAMALTVRERRAIGAGGEIGLGWMISSPPSGEVLRHGGGTGGFRTFMGLQPETGRAALVLTNSAVEPSAEDIGMHLLTGSPVANAFPVPPAPPRMEPQEEVTLSPEQLDRVAGTYEMAPGALIVVRRQDDGARPQLVAQLTGQPPFPIFPSAPLEFFWRVVEARIRFVEEGGAITGAVLLQNGAEMPARRIDQP
jgi:CubicO group peptidase (beta-lactamase class C family)